jgi:NAD(P)-dependent dehydrogenase (short-subunit alcohol dehydrogenase family)
LKTILITGGAGGIATAIAEALVARGDRVVVFDRTEPRVATSWENVDVTDEIGLELALNRVRSVHARIDGIVCAAGVVSESPLAQMTLDEWRRVVDISLTGTFLALRAVLPAMIEAKSGKIVAFSSGYGRKGYKFGAHYAAAKAGIEALVKSTALEVAPLGITVNAIAPGPIETPFLELVEDPGRYERTAQMIPMGRIGVPADVVGAALFFLDPSSDYITGQVLHVNGGFLMP